MGYFLVKWSFWLKVWRNFSQKDGVTQASSFSFTVLLSFIPFLLSITWIIKFIPLPHMYIDKLEKSLFMHFLPTMGDFLYQRFKFTLAHTHDLSWMGFGGMFITAYISLKSLEQYLNRIWQVRQTRNIRSFLLIYVFFMLLGPLIMGVMVVLQLYAKVYAIYGLKIILSYLNYSIGILLFILIYKVLPAAKVKLKHAILTGVIAGSFFEIAKRGFVIYISNFSVYNKLYGSLAAFPVFLLWVHICSLILFFCAQITYTLGEVDDKKN
ncbi:MAG: YihY family inner membrane protein [Burkholderiales bacterium]|nr:YihY family inner membrane protein [Burkholderiales bacterium]